jgi:two-component system sensor histidine kinase KdpD
VRLTVRDTGPGIPPGAHEAIFGRFHRLDPAARGSGLGLAVARAIVERHGGRLWAEQAPEGGAVFHVTLPHSAEAEGLT